MQAWKASLAEGMAVHTWFCGRGHNWPALTAATAAKIEAASNKTRIAGYLDTA